MALTRPTFAGQLELIEPQLTLFYYQQTTEGATWHLMEQGKAIEANPKTPQKFYRRAGDTSAVSTRGATEVTATLTIYEQLDLAEFAAVLGVPKPASGWTGTEKIGLDGTKKVNIKAVTFVSTADGAAEAFTEYLEGFGPTDIKPGSDADGDARMVVMTGVADKYYRTPVKPA